MSWFSRLFRRPAPTVPARVPAAESVRVRGRAGIDPAASPYLFPNDLSEMQRLDLQHYILREALQRNIIAPVAAPRRILDVGTGTGRWAYEVARQFPDAEVVGVDIVAPQRPYREAGEPPAPNYTFQIANVLEGLPFPDRQFDYVHMRLLVTGIPAAQWPGVVRELARVTAPGGWVESIEVTAPEHGGAAMEQIAAWFTAALAARKVEFALGSQIERFMRAAGLTNVAVTALPLPLGKPGGRVGNLMAVDIFMAARGFGAFFVQTGKVSQAEFDATLQQAEADVQRADNRCIVPHYVVVGQQPA